MAYKNWESGGMTQQEIKTKLTSEEFMGKGKGGENLHNATIEDLHKAGVKLINRMQEEMKNDKTLPVRASDYTGADSECRNVLLSYKEYLETRVSKDINLKNLKANMADINYVAEKIDDYENQQLEKSKYYGSGRFLNSIRRSSKEQNIPCSFVGKHLTIDGNPGDKSIQNLGLFSDRNVYEYYRTKVDGKRVLNADVTWRDVEGFKNEIILDYGGCSESDKRKILEFLSYTDIFDENILKEDNYKIVVRIVNNGNEENIIERKSFSDNKWYNLPWGLPITKKLEIYDKQEVDSGISVRASIAERRERFDVLGEIDCEDWNKSPEEQEGWDEYLEFFGEGKNELKWALSELPNKDYNRFIVATENRIRNLANKADSSGFHLATPPIKDMSIEFWDRNFEKKYVYNVRNRDGTHPNNRQNKRYLDLGEDLYKIVDKHEDEYEQYLTNSINSKWSKVEDLKPDERKERENEKPLDDEKKYISYGLDILESFFEEVVNEEKGDANFEKGLYEIRKIKRRINSGNPIYYGDVSSLAANIAEIVAKDKHAQNRPSENTIHHDWIRPIIWGHKRENSRGQSSNIIQEEAFRLLSKEYEYAGHDAQVDRLTRLRNPDGSRMIETKNNSEYNDCLKRIDFYFTVNDEEISFQRDNGEIVISNAFIRRALLVPGYFEHKDPSDLEDLLYTLEILPDGYQDRNKEQKEEFYELLGKIHQLIMDRKKEMDKMKPPTREKVRNQRRKRLKDLSDKNENDKLSTDEKEEYGILLGYEANPELAYEMAELSFNNTKELMLYSGINDIIYTGLSVFYGKISGGTNNDIINDIKGIDNLSDDTLAIVNEVVGMLKEEAAIRFITTSMGYGLPAICAGVYTAVKGVSLAVKAGKLGIRAQRMFEKMRPYLKMVRDNLKSFARTKIGQIAKKTGNNFVDEVEKDVARSSVKGEDTNVVKDLGRAAKGTITSGAKEKVTGFVKKKT